MNGQHTSLLSLCLFSCLLKFLFDGSLPCAVPFAYPHSKKKRFIPCLRTHRGVCRYVFLLVTFFFVLSVWTKFIPIDLFVLSGIALAFPKLWVSGETREGSNGSVLMQPVAIGEGICFTKPGAGWLVTPLYSV